MSDQQPSDPVSQAAYSGAVLIAPDGQILLQLRDDKPEIRNPGGVSLFGGGAEPGEPALACVLRELEEETGVAFASGRLQFLDIVVKEEPGLTTLCSLYAVEGVAPEMLAITEGTA